MSVTTPATRLQSLDQFRGYTVAGMFLVNFLGSYEVCPRILRHTHDYCSYADTIMPHFLFAVGFALRLSFLKHQEHGGGREAWRRMIRRIASLALIAIVFYSFDGLPFIVQSISEKGLWTTLGICLKRNWMQTLLHIAVTSLWILPVIGAALRVRVAYAIFSGITHVALSAWFYFLWVNGIPGGVNGIDGGPLGFLTWSIVAIAGTWACDVCREIKYAAPPVIYRAILRMAVIGMILAGMGWLFSCGTTIYDVPEDRIEELRGEKFAKRPVVPSQEQLATWSRRPAEPPFVPPPDAAHRQWNYWMMSQRAGTLSYLTFSAGFSLIVFALFVWMCDVIGMRIGLFRTLGVNALAGYILAGVAEMLVKPYLQKASPAVEVAAGFAVFFVLVYVVLRVMEWRKIYLRM